MDGRDEISSKLIGKAGAMGVEGLQRSTSDMKNCDKNFQTLSHLSPSCKFVEHIRPPWSSSVHPKWGSYWKVFRSWNFYFGAWFRVSCFSLLFNYLREYKVLVQFCELLLWDCWVALNYNPICCIIPTPRWTSHKICYNFLVLRNQTVAESGAKI